MATTKELIEKVNSAFKANDMATFNDMLAEEVIWEIHGSKNGHVRLNGKKEINEMEDEGMPQQMDFDYKSVIVDGNVAVVEGIGSGLQADGRTYKVSFCDVYHFENEKIVKLTSYTIDGSD